MMAEEDLAAPIKAVVAVAVRAQWEQTVPAESQVQEASEFQIRFLLQRMLDKM
jgi:hypothetical protein